MRKSNKCEYTIGVNTKKKRKFLRPEEAMAEAARLNELPHVIKKCVAYKCTVCYFFHVGRTHEDLHHDPLMIPQHEPEEMLEEIKELVAEEVLVEEPKHDENFDWSIKRVPIKEEIISSLAPEKKAETEHDDFDWDKDRRLF